MNSDFLEILRKRRSIRKFKNKAIPEDVIITLKESLLRSPSSRSFDPWSFIFVDDLLLLKELSRCKEHGSNLIAGAPLGIVVIADSMKSDVWIEDCSIASIILNIQACELGLGACWVQIRNRNTKGGDSSEEFVKSLLLIPQEYRVLSIISIGYPNENKKGHDSSILKYERIFNNRFGNE